MKKTFVFAAAACVALAACNKEQPDISSPEIQREISVMSVNDIATKGYVSGVTFYDTAVGELQKGDNAETTVRQMHISSFMYPQNGDNANYFEGMTFKEWATADGGDGKWHNYNGDSRDPIYWPVGGKLDFLAYSAQQAFADEDVAWSSGNVANQVVLKVNEDYTQDDIVFASVYGRNSATGATAVPMMFKHAQAWIEFQLRTSASDDSMDGIVQIRKIELANAYEKGELTINNNEGNASASWNFRNETAKNVVVDDVTNLDKNGEADGVAEPVYSNSGTHYLGSDVEYLDMLIPEQQKTAFIVYYTLGSSARELSFRYEFPKENWLMGKKYIYAINFTANEITVEPTVSEYNVQTVETVFPALLTSANAAPGETMSLLDFTMNPGTKGRINWGDGTVEEFDGSGVLTAEHTYASAFTGTVEMFVDEGFVAGETQDNDEYKRYSIVDRNKAEIKLIFVPELVPGVFTVNSAGKKVRFVKGNLYWNGNEFRCEANQYDSPLLGYSQKCDANHIMIFYWSPYAKVACAEDYNSALEEFGITPDLTSDTFFLLNGELGESFDGFTLLTRDEWQYLHQKTYQKFSKQQISATINGTICSILAPDDFNGTVADVYTAAEWAAAETAYGLVALPLYDTSASNGIVKGSYWTSMVNPSRPDGVYYVNFTSSKVNNPSTGCCYPEYPCAARLVQVEPTEGF